jgi:hypothetical protein
MPVSTTDLMQKIYEVFASAYAARANGSAFLAFEKLGVPLTDGMFKLNETDAAESPALARERLSEIAIRVIEADANSVVRTSRNVDAMTELLLTEAMPLTPAQMAPLGDTRTAAHKNFDQTLGSLDGLSTFHPINASPVDWYASGNAANWISHTVGDHQTTTSGAPSPIPRVVMRPPLWRVLPPPMHPALAHPVAPSHPLMLTAAMHQLPAPAVGQRPVVRPIMPLIQHPVLVHQPVEAAHPIATPLHPAPPPHPPVPIVRPLIAAQAVANIHAAGTAQPVATTNVDLSFDHCIVTLQWPWFPQVFLMDRGWYVPGYTKGSFSNGAGNGDTGYLPVLAGGFVVIRNLKISGQWTNQDLAAVQGSAAFGPFSLIGRTYDAHSGMLSCPGMQIIGWFCEALPVLPPNSDPALIAAAAPAVATIATPASAGANPSTPPSVTTSVAQAATVTPAVGTTPANSTPTAAPSPPAPAANGAAVSASAAPAAMPSQDVPSVASSQPASGASAASSQAPGSTRSS